jgi:hypothetical protein
MKQGSNPKRSRGRGSPRRDNTPRNQSLESSGPEVRIRGTVSQVLEKYLALARDASSAGDLISAENYLQHAEHYYRVMNGNGGGSSSGGQKFRGQGRPRGNGGETGLQPTVPAAGGGDGSSRDAEANAAAPEAKPEAPSLDAETDSPDTTPSSA